MQKLRETVAALRAPDGCPWDRVQTHQSLCDCLIDETSELLDTIDRNDSEHMREELGDVLLQVFLHAQIAQEAGEFTLDDVALELDAKLIRRHPHVFGNDERIGNSEAVLKRWDEIKAAEKKRSPQVEGPFKHLPPQLPALLFARHIYKQITKESLPAAGHVDTASIKELANGLTEAKAGKLLFELAAACRIAGIDPESALRRHTAKVVEGVTTEFGLRHV